MVQVRLTCGRVGDRFSQTAGETVEVSAEEARRLIESHLAEPAVPADKVETAAKRTGKPGK